MINTADAPPATPSVIHTARRDPCHGYVTITSQPPRLQSPPPSSQQSAKLERAIYALKVKIDTKADGERIYAELDRLTGDVEEIKVEMAVQNQ